MAAIGTFDALPYHMVKQTIGYVVEQTNEIDMFSFDEEEDNMFCPLLHVCRSWRTVALSVMLTGCDVTLDKQVKFAYHSVKEHTCITNTVNNSYNMHVTTVHLSINFSSILDGSVAAQLEAEAAKHIRFQKANTLQQMNPRLEFSLEQFSKSYYYILRVFMYCALPFHVVKQVVEYATTDQDEFDDSVATFALELVPKIPDVVPFPRLTVLEMGFNCPFSDDVLLRGNHGTLDELIIRLDYKTMQILSTYQASLRRPSRLSYLVIVETNPEISKQYAHTIHTFMSNIIPQLDKLFINGQNILGHLLDLLTHSPVYCKLQRLVMFGCEIQLVQLVTLLQTFPKLKKLSCNVTSFGHEAMSMDLVSLIRPLHNQLKPLKLHLGEWILACGQDVPVDIIAMSIILLASTCPHLKSVCFSMHLEGKALKVFSRVCMLQQSGEFNDIVDSNMYFSLTTISPYSVIRISTSVFSLSLPKLN
ncbi:hypothetical protein GGH96_004727 [Coemansia sp. RSA 1972]|nr:hypothetical protein GGH96_004727 [Coemansia sp. RSA 1972]